MKSLILAATASLLQLVNTSDESVVKIKSDNLEKVYTVLFGGPKEHDVEILLKDKRGKKLIEEQITAHGFRKMYQLSKLPNGKYTFYVSYAGRVYKQDIELKSREAVMQESIVMGVEDKQLTIDVKSYNREALNIFITNLDQDLLEAFLWEPKDNKRTKTIDLSKHEGKDVIVQVVQNGEETHLQTISVY
ncbi:MAG: hypothetical protein KI790_15090 [Cyclobacteriaceae bacterium]|nr:hypothetical protein [Cyclobacteriaceae bacterium HetDA_MAG_MS6]